MKEIYKKILTLLVLFVFAFMFVGCEQKEGAEVAKINGKDPQEVYDLARQQLKDLTSYTLKGKVTEDIELEGEKMSYEFDIVQMIDGTNIYSEMTSDSAELASMCYKMWGTDSAIYEIASGMQIKVSMGVKEFMESQGMDMFSENLLFDLGSGYFSGTKFNKVDGGYEIRASIDTKKYLNDLKDSALSSILSSIGEDDIKKIEYIITVDEKANFIGMKMELDMVMSQFSNASCKVVCDYDFETPCSSMKALPEGCENWTDYTAYFAK